MDDEDFDDLLAGAEVLEFSSQESLTNAAADLTCNDWNEPYGIMQTPPSSIAMETHGIHELDITSKPIHEAEAFDTWFIDGCLADAPSQQASPPEDEPKYAVIDVLNLCSITADRLRQVDRDREDRSCVRGHCRCITKRE